MPNASYQWQPATGLSCTDCAQPLFSLPTPGTYRYQLLVTRCHIPDTFQVQVEVIDAGLPPSLTFSATALCPAENQRATLTVAGGEAL